MKVLEREQMEKAGWRPKIGVWELTLACNLRCKHCGSTAGRARRDEMDTATCLDVAAQLSALGCELITLSGGEPTLREDWDVIGAALKRGGTQVNMVSNGMYRDRLHAQEIAQRALAVGMPNVGISVDGPQAIHDLIRAPGSFAKTIASIETFLEEGLDVAMMTAVNRLNFAALEQTWALARSLGVSQWRVQLAKPMGNLDASRELVLSPQQFVALVDQVAALKQRPGLHVCVGDSLGYFGKHEELLRRRGRKGRGESWQGCQAGLRVIGIEANGNVKGCLSLQAFQGDDDRFVEGNLQRQSLEQIWYAPNAFAYNRQFEPDTLAGACRSCRHAERCRGGARCVSAAFDGVINEDRYCYTALVPEPVASPSSWRAGAAALAAGLLLSVSAEGCKTTPPPSTNEEKTEPAVSDEYGVRPTELEDAVEDALMPSVTAEYAVREPEPALEYGVMVPTEPEPVSDYGVMPSPEPEPVAEYGVMVAPEPEPVAEYGVMVPTEPEPVSDYGVMPSPEPEPVAEYGVMVAPEPEPVAEYGVMVPAESDVVDSD
ncbi:MAG: radical SAM protein [Myxococcota bacterium]|nr:radical SAM protein [Myxococcota bacterium]